MTKNRLENQVCSGVDMQNIMESLNQSI